MSNEQCDIMYVHEDKVKNASNFLNETHTIKAMNTLNAIGDKKKLTILFALLEEEKLCVCDIAKLLQMSIASTSHHLRILYKKEVIDFRKEGKMVYYFIKDPQVDKLLRFMLTEVENENS